MSDPSTVRFLLHQTGKLLAVRREQLRRSGGCFNIFSILDIETKEVQTHNHLLYELLNPEGSHGMGDKFLREFFRIVLDANYPDTPVQVFREYPCSAGQIDLILLGEKFCYPIEIKIHAPDQPLQVKRYADYAAVRAADSRVFYLTLDGHKPTEYSTGGGIAFTCISFAYEIRKWLIQCGKIAWSVPAVSGIIQQYIQLIDKLTNRMEDVYMDMIQDMVGGSRSNFESAAAIADAVTKAKADLLRRILSGIEEHIGNRMELAFYDYDECADLYSVKPQVKNSPYLTYKVAKLGRRTLYIEIIIDERLYYSLYLCNADGEYDENATNRLPKLLPEPAWKEFIMSLEKTKVWWKFLPDTSAELLPDFHNCNDHYLNLFDKPQFEVWMQQVYREINVCIKKMRKIGLLGYDSSNT